jgi:hypothetical protein
MRQFNYYFYKTLNCGNEDNIIDANEFPKILKFHIFQENTNIPKNLNFLKFSFVSSKWINGMVIDMLWSSTFITIVFFLDGILVLIDQLGS